MSNRYIPSPTPSIADDLPNYTQEELKRVSETVNNISDGHLDKTHVEPAKPRDGDIRYADGSDWNPGQGENLYYFDGTIWRAYAGGSGAGDYAGFSNTSDITASSSNTAYPINWNTTVSAQGISLNGSDTSKIEFTHGGVYHINFVATICSSSGSTKALYFFPRVNGTDIAGAGIVSTIHENGQKKVVARNGMFEVSAGDYLQAVWATDSTSAWLEADSATAFSPSVPSVTITISQLSQ